MTTQSSITEPYMISADPDTGGPYGGTITVEWSGDALFPTKEFAAAIKKWGRQTIAPHALVSLVYAEMIKHLPDSPFVITVLADSLHHGTLTITTGRE